MDKHCAVTLRAVSPSKALLSGHRSESAQYDDADHADVFCGASVEPYAAEQSPVRSTNARAVEFPTGTVQHQRFVPRSCRDVGPFQ
jgi:hypothetical protein